MALMWVPGRSHSPAKTGSTTVGGRADDVGLLHRRAHVAGGGHRDAQAGAHLGAEGGHPARVDRDDQRPFHRPDRADGRQLGAGLGAGAEEGDHPAVGARQVARRHAAGRSRAHGGQVLGVQQGQRFARAGVVQQDHAVDGGQVVKAAVVVVDRHHLDGQRARIAGDEGGHGQVDPVVGGDGVASRWGMVTLPRASWRKPSSTAAMVSGMVNSASTSWRERISMGGLRFWVLVGYVGGGLYLAGVCTASRPMGETHAVRSRAVSCGLGGREMAMRSRQLSWGGFGQRMDLLGECKGGGISIPGIGLRDSARATEPVADSRNADPTPLALAGREGIHPLGGAAG